MGDPVSDIKYYKCMFCLKIFNEECLEDNTPVHTLCRHDPTLPGTSSLQRITPPDDDVRRLIEIAVWTGWTHVYFGKLEYSLSNKKEEFPDRWYGLPTERSRVYRSIEDYFAEVSLWDTITSAIIDRGWRVTMEPFNANKLAFGARVAIQNRRKYAFAAEDGYSIRDAFFDCYHAALYDDIEYNRS